MPQLEQVSYNGRYGRERGQTALFVTERAVFRTGEQGLELIEIAPGIDLEQDVLAQMNFRPHVTTNLRLMDERLFGPQPMGIIESFRTRSRPLHSRLSDFELSSAVARRVARAVNA